MSGQKRRQQDVFLRVTPQVAFQSKAATNVQIVYPVRMLFYRGYSKSCDPCVQLDTAYTGSEDPEGALQVVNSRIIGFLAADAWCLSILTGSLAM